MRIVLLLLFLLAGFSYGHGQDSKSKEAKKTAQSSQKKPGTKDTAKKDAGDDNEGKEATAGEKDKKKKNGASGRSPKAPEPGSTVKNKKKPAAEEKKTEVIDIEQVKAIEELDKELIPEKELQKRQEKAEREQRKLNKEEEKPDSTAVEREDIKEKTGKDHKIGKREAQPLLPATVKNIKQQKPQRPKVNIDDEKQKEYAFYTERLGRNPDSVDVLIKLPAAPTPAERDRIKLDKAMELMRSNYPDKALILLKQLHAKGETHPNLNYWLGRAYLQSYAGSAKAVPYLKKAAEKTDFKYDFNNPSVNALAPVDALYYLGRAYHLSGDLENARRSYQLFTGVSQDKKAAQVSAAETHLKQLNVAEALLANVQKGVQVKNAGPQINSLYPDFAAKPTFDGSELFFTSSRPRQDTAVQSDIDYQFGLYTNDIYISRVTGPGRFTKPQLVSINTTGNEILNDISPNAKIISAYMEGEDYADFYESTYAFDAWQLPIEIIPAENTLKWGRHFTLNADRSKIFFASNELEGFGGFDLFMSERRADGSWSKPVNMGPRVNSKHNENMPFLHPNGRTLFFSSDGENSMGGYDVFKTDFVGDWTNPENIGSPVNSFGDDVYFALAYDGKTAYYSRQAEGGYGDLDIYQVTYTTAGFLENPELQAKFDIDLKNLDNSTEVEVTHAVTRERKTYKPNIRTGLFTVSVEPCTRYIIVYRKQGTTVKTEEFLSPCDLNR